MNMTTDRRYGVIAGIAIKAPCDAATTAAITLSGEQTIDGVAVVTGNRVLVKNQVDTTTNGIYVVDTSTWSRDVDFDNTYDATQGTMVKIISGTANGGTIAELTTANPITIGSSNLVFALRTGTLSALSVSAGSWLTNITAFVATLASAATAAAYQTLIG